MTALACSSCRRALPEAAAPGLARELVEALGDEPEGMTATEAAKRVSRRRTAVEDELERLRGSGVVERSEGRRRPRGWNARPWRLTTGPGQDRDERQSATAAGSELPPAVAELGLSAALSAALGARSVAAAYTFLLAVGLFIVGLVLEAWAIVPTSRTEGQA